VKLRYVVACLLCLLLFVAAIDQIPDPPAVNPHNRESGRVLALHGHEFSALQQKVLVSFDSKCYVRTSSCASRLTFENKLFGLYHVILVRHSADPSPPILS
jgi:hypothetical protein